MWSQGGHRPIIVGLLVGALALVLIAYVLLRATRRLPIGKFFGYSSALIAVLAIVLVGKGIVALQEAGWLNIHAINGPRVSVLGIYPNLQSIMGQCLVVALVFAGILYNRAGAKRDATA
jgi:high-affinity iron transporter